MDTSHQLRSYIAPGAPARRCPCDGAEPALRVEFGFTPRWYRTALGIDFSERWHLDPAYRRETVVAMRCELNRRFPALGLGGDRPKDAPATIDGIHGALLVPMVFGIPAKYYTGNWPAAPHEVLSEQAIASLEVPNLPDVPVFAQVLAQMDAIEREFGPIRGYLNWQGVLNSAYRLRGQAILSDLMTQPHLAHHLFDIVSNTMIQGAKTVYGRQRKSGFDVRHFVVSNCLVNMVSPEHYREHLMPYDQRISDAFDHFGIHNCAWNIDPYLEDYARIRTLGYIDMGLESNMARAKRLCPNTRRAVMYTPTDLTNKPLDAIREDLARIRHKLAPCDIVMADIDADTPDDRVLAFANLVAQSAES